MNQLTWLCILPIVQIAVALERPLLLKRGLWWGLTSPWQDTAVHGAHCSTEVCLNLAGQFWDPHHYLHAQSLQLQQQVHWAKQIFYWHYSKLTKVPSSVADLGWFISACSPVSAANSPVFNILAKFEKFSKRPFMNSPKIDTLLLGSYIRGEIFFEKNKILGIKD